MLVEGGVTYSGRAIPLPCVLTAIAKGIMPVIVADAVQKTALLDNKALQCSQLLGHTTVALPGPIVEGENPRPSERRPPPDHTTAGLPGMPSSIPHPLSSARRNEGRRDQRGTQ